MAFATNEVYGGSNPSPGSRFRARAGNGNAHQPPKLDPCEFESHRAFHAGIVQRQDTRPISEKSGFKPVSPHQHYSGLAQR